MDWGEPLLAGAWEPDSRVPMPERRTHRWAGADTLGMGVTLCGLVRVTRSNPWALVREALLSYESCSICDGMYAFGYDPPLWEEGQRYITRAHAWPTMFVVVYPQGHEEHIRLSDPEQATLLRWGLNGIRFGWRGGRENWDEGAFHACWMRLRDDK